VLHLLFVLLLVMLILIVILIEYGIYTCLVSYSVDVVTHS